MKVLAIIDTGSLKTERLKFPYNKFLNCGFLSGFE